MCLIFILGIYEIFSKEVFGVKVKNLEFGLQPHKIPDTETVSPWNCICKSPIYESLL